MNLDFEIADKPERRSGPKRSKYVDLKRSLMSLEPGKAIKLPRDTFGFGAAETSLRMKRECGRPTRQRKNGDSIYIWLDPKEAA